MVVYRAIIYWLKLQARFNLWDENNCWWMIAKSRTARRNLQPFLSGVLGELGKISYGQSVWLDSSQ